MKITERIAYMLPRKVIYWGLIRAGVEATTGKYSNTLVPAVTFVDVLQRWDKGR